MSHTTITANAVTVPEVASCFVLMNGLLFCLCDRSVNLSALTPAEARVVRSRTVSRAVRFNQIWSRQSSIQRRNLFKELVEAVGRHHD